MSKLNITITGELGSGKSSIAKTLCKLLDYKYFYTGGIQRQIGKKSGMNTLELNYFSETNHDIDKYIDDLVIKLNDDEDSYVIDSRMAWHFIHKSFKIFTTVNPVVAAKRVIADKHRDSEPIVEDIYEKSLNLLERRAAEDKRFKTKYGVDCSELANFDLVIDTTLPTVEEISKLIIKLYADFSNNGAINKYWVSPKSLFPTQDVRKDNPDEAGKINGYIYGNDYDKSSVVKTVKLGSDLFIYDGHKRVSACVFNKIPLIPVDILAKDYDKLPPGNRVSDFIETTYNPVRLYEWEDVHGFIFRSYPKSIKNR